MLGEFRKERFLTVGGMREILRGEPLVQDLKSEWTVCMWKGEKEHLERMGSWKHHGDLAS